MLMESLKNIFKILIVTLLLFSSVEAGWLKNTVKAGAAAGAVKAYKIAKEKKLLEKLKAGRAGKQKRLRELANDDKVSSSDKGWIKQEINSIEQGKRKNIRNPMGKDLAHERGREASKGYGYENANLQDKSLHKLQHKYDNFGKKNKERPIRDDR